MNFRISKIILKCALLPAFAMLGGCASNQALVTLSPVGPDSNRAVSGNGPGHLIVYNTSHEAMNRDGAMTYPHDDYKIYNERRACIKKVANRSGAEGELPDRVDLPTGRYTIVTKSQTQGAVAVPVIIKSNLTTVVNLEAPTRSISGVAAN